MGSINCKEYVTNSTNNSTANPTNNNGTSGTYQSSCDTNMSDSEYTEYIKVCNEDEILDNQMKQLPLIEDVKVLLIKQNGQISAVGNKCAHYGALLHTGVLGNGRVRCPWHGACFDIATGDVEDFPGLDSLPCYQVKVDEGQVKVRAKKKDLDESKRIKDMVKRVESDKRTFVIIGGGPSGAVCAETLRQEGFTGRIVMLCRERHLPYDRVKLSKSPDISINTIQFRKMTFYEEYNIEPLLGVSATKVDSEQKLVHCSNGETIRFDMLYIATGGLPIKPPIIGAEHRNVVTLREVIEANAIAHTIKPEMNAVCLGSSFISLEVAAYMASKAKSVTIVGRDKLPLRASFGDAIGKRIMELFQENNVNMIMNCGIEEIVANNEGRVSKVLLTNGTELPCDLLVMGTGTRLCTGFLEGSGVAVNANGSIDTDMHLRTNVPYIYAGGDIANAPVYPNANQRATIGHYQLAQYHGRVAAMNMAGKLKVLRAVPYFFTMLFGKAFRYSGYGQYADVLIDGDLRNWKFAVYYLDHYNNVVAVASCGRDPIVSQFAELQAQGKRLHRTDVVDAEETTTWTEMLKKPSCVA